MKRLILVSFAFALVLSLVALAQETTKSRAQQSKATTEKKTTQEVTLSDKVSTDGKTLVSDKDNNGTVDNPDVKEREVTLKAHAEKRRTLSTVYPSRTRQTRCPK